ncbi:type II toxin-antitoxin system RatA family toxin [Ectothiorhodospiraceae bacterium BW-2]|nr:type II toxin-antitoxin system RatA family toxin [Ectothiorhodospiraceae bacterium BW-2]
MESLQKSALVEYSPQQMYDLVNNVAAYPDFLPWCSQARAEIEQPGITLATINIAHGSLKKSFTTRNELKEGEEIQMYLVKGPFKHLHGHWRFLPLPQRGCKILLNIEFQFSNRLISIALGPVFNQICNSLVDAFVKRAAQIYT